MKSHARVVVIGGGVVGGAVVGGGVVGGTVVGGGLVINASHCRVSGL